MSKIEDLQNTIERIKEMEEMFDVLLDVWKKEPVSLRKDVAMKEKLQRLIAYYEGGLWLEDYEKDEQGLLPKELKRGVLSEDGIYNFLSEIR